MNSNVFVAYRTPCLKEKHEKMQYHAEAREKLGQQNIANTTPRSAVDCDKNLYWFKCVSKCKSSYWSMDK